MLTVCFLLLASQIALAEADSLVFVGVGAIGQWITEMTGANPTASDLSARVDTEPRFEPPGVCTIICPVYFLLTPNASETLDSDEVGRAAGAVTTLYVTSGEGRPLPSVRARVVNAARPEQAISVPGFRLSTLLSLNPATLAFPGARRSATARTNLVVADLRELNHLQGRGLSIEVEAYGARGNRLASASFSLSPGETRFLVDVLGQLGLESLDGGQIRVRKSSVEGYLWGTLFTTDADGTITVSVGATP
jgi:hypothetical protein